MQALIEDLLNLSSLNSGQIPLHIVSCDLGALCHDIVEDYKELSGRAITLTLPGRPAVVQADIERMRQVITNLVSNAVKYSAENGTIRVAIEQRHMETLLKVHNDGASLAREELQRIFEPFYRTHHAEAVQVGWGLGLSITQAIVERHEGKIWVESELGRGVTFLVSLPHKSEFHTR